MARRKEWVGVWVQRILWMGSRAERNNNNYGKHSQTPTASPSPSPLRIQENIHSDFGGNGGIMYILGEIGIEAKLEGDGEFI